MREEVEAYANLYFDSAMFYGVMADSSCTNGYLSIVLSQTYDEGHMDSPTYHYKPVSAVWDLYTGKRLKFTDMFWKNEDFIATVNSNIRMGLDSANNKGYTELMGEFWALPETFDTFSLDNVYFASKEGIFTHGVAVDYTTYCNEMLVTSQQRDMKDIWEDPGHIEQGRYSYSFLNYGISVEYDDFAFWMLDAEKLRMDKAVADKINNYMKKQVEENLTSKALDAKFGKDNYSFDFDFTGVYFTVSEKNYIFYSGFLPITYRDGEEKSIDLCVSAVFNYKTGNRLDFDDILSKGWKNEIKWIVEDPHNINDLSLINFKYYSYHEVLTDIECYDRKKCEIVSFYVPKKYLLIHQDY